MDGPPLRLIDGAQQPGEQPRDLAALIAALNPRRKYDLEQRLRFMAQTSETWAEQIYIAIADLIAASQAHPSA